MHFLILFSQAHPLLIYGAAFLMMFIEGDISLLVFGALVRGHLIGFSQAFLVAFVATLIHDALFWRLGEWLGRRQKKKYLYFNLDTFVGFMERYRSFVGIFIVLSKFAWNFNRIVLVSVGYIKIPLKRVMKYSFITALLWPSLYMTIGYIFADQLDIFRQRIEIVALAVVGIIVLLMLFERFIRKIVDKAFTNGDESQTN
ncbi:MAG: hypothetical protein M1320_00565 [Patescibacteria group bacterium]|nr:hypothetical protein [Patescibacteria group bacterium]